MPTDLPATVTLPADGGQPERTFELDTALIGLDVHELKRSVSSDAMHQNAGVHTDSRLLFGSPVLRFTDRFAFLSKTDVRPFEEGDDLRLSITARGDDGSRIYASDGLGFGVSISAERFDFIWHEAVNMPDACLRLMADIQVYRRRDEFDSVLYLPTFAPARILPCDISLEPARTPPAMPPVSGAMDGRLKAISNLLLIIVGLLVVLIVRGR